MAIRGRGPRTSNELLEILTEFEETVSFCEHQQGRPFQQLRGQNDRRPNGARYQHQRPQTGIRNETPCNDIG